jgi:light-regulated signal transduction histidine kinase (bacteriophytochrome)
MFNYLASHDLQEPLRKIETYSTLIVENFKENISPITEAYLYKVNDESRLMRRLLTSLLEYTSIPDARSNSENVDLNKMLDHLPPEVHTKVLAKKATIKVESLPVIRGSYSQFHQIFLHLLDNSLTFSKEGVDPEIRVSCKKIESGIEISKQLKDSPYWVISFADNGTGFDSKFKFLIFDIFQKGLNSKSLGVGLSIARKLVELNEGIITADSEPGNGAVFTIYLPVRE